MRDEDATRRPTTHEVGERLDALSLAELDTRILLLQTEIARIEAAKATKQKAAAAATSFFKT